MTLVQAALIRAGDVTVQWAANNTGAATGVTRHANSYLSHRIP